MLSPIKYLALVVSVIDNAKQFNHDDDDNNRI